MCCLPNVNPFSEGNIDDNTDLAVLITEYSYSEPKKYCMRKSALSLILALTRIKPIQRRRCGENCLDVLQLLDFIRISVAFSWQFIILKYFTGSLHAISSKCLERECIVSCWLGKYNWSSLGWMKNADSTSKSIEDTYQYWLGQSGTISIPAALSEIIFCMTFSIQENRVKQWKSILSQFTVNA